MELYITKNELRRPSNTYAACPEGYRKLMRGIEYEDAEVVRIPISLILDVNGPDDADWALYTLKDLKVLSYEDSRAVRQAEMRAIIAADQAISESSSRTTWDSMFRTEWTKNLAALLPTLSRSANDRERTGTPAGGSYVYD